MFGDHCDFLLGADLFERVRGSSRVSAVRARAAWEIAEDARP